MTYSKNKNKRKKLGLGDFIKNYGKGVADFATTAIGMDNVITDNDYTGSGAKLFNTLGSSYGKISQTVLPLVANSLLPGSGTAITGMQQGLGQFNPQDQNNNIISNQNYNPTQLNFAMGGEVKDQILNSLPNGGSHENNPMGGIPIGQNASVEQGEAIANIDETKYVFSDRLKPDGKKKSKSFAKLAEAIKGKYKRANFDAIERQDMKDELRELINQQETYKMQNGIGNYSNQDISNQMAYGGKMKYQTGGDIPFKFNSLEEAQIFFKTNPDLLTDDLIVGGKNATGENYWKNFGELSFNAYNNRLPNIKKKPIENETTPNINLLNKRKASVTIENNNDTNNFNKAYIQGLLGLLPTLGGAAYLGAFSKPDYVNYDRLSPEEISLAREREIANQQAGNLSSVLADKIKGSTARNIAAQTAIQRNLGEQLGSSYQRENVYNVGERSRINQLNQQIGMRETEANAMENAAIQQRKDQALKLALQGAVNYGQDIMAGDRYNQMLSTISDSGKYIIDPNTGKIIIK